MNSLKSWVIIFAVTFVFTGCTHTELQIKSPHFNFLLKSGTDYRTDKKLVNILESNYRRIGQFLGTRPDSPIQVNIYSGRIQYVIATGNWTASGSIEGTSKLHFIQQAWDETDIGKIAVHEFTHTVTLKLLINQEPKPLDSKKFDKKFATFPTWLWESISIYEANQFVDPKSLPYFNNNTYPSLAELNDRSKGQKIYKVGYVLVEYILQKYGRDKLLALISHYGDIPGVLDTSEADFMKGWNEFVKKKYLNKNTR